MDARACRRGASTGGPRARRVDMGSADELALDVLINCLTTFSREQVGIKQVVFGGENDDWELPEDVGPQVTMDPMRGPEYF
jgi:hypothetical protein